MSFGTGIVKEKSIKGDYAEELIEEFFIKNNYEVYSPSGKQAHLFDGIAIKKEFDGEYKTIYFDVKSKAARNLYPDTGVDYKHYIHYQDISVKFNTTFLIIFVDEELGKIYFQNIKKYMMPGDQKANKVYYDQEEIRYPKFENNEDKNEKYIYFSLETMGLIKELSEEEINKLKAFSKNTNKSFSFNPLWDVTKYLNK